MIKSKEDFSNNIVYKSNRKMFSRLIKYKQCTVTILRELFSDLLICGFWKLRKNKSAKRVSFLIFIGNVLMTMLFTCSKTYFIINRPTLSSIGQLFEFKHLLKKTLAHIWHSIVCIGERSRKHNPVRCSMLQKIATVQQVTCTYVQCTECVLLLHFFFSLIILFVQTKRFCNS